MSHHHQLVCGSLFVFFAATHVGCAGSGLKNMFTRNETDGYHSLDELETEEQPVAETEIPGDEVEKSSLVTRLSSWRPFSKTEPTEEETSAVVDADTSDADSEDAGRSPRFPGRAFTKRESVEPDPFLSAEPKLADGPESPSFNAVPHAEIAKIDEKSKKVDDEDDALGKRFEQHFLLNSVGTVAKTETEATAVGNDLRQKVSSMAESKKRELSGIADRQIDQFDFLLAAQPESDETTSEFRRNADAELSHDSKRSASTARKSEHSLAAFDQFLGTVGSEASRETNTTARIPEEEVAAMDINVADAEALFGAAGRRSKSLPQPETTLGMESSDRHIARSSAWSQASENSAEFEWKDSRHEKPESASDSNRDDVDDRSTVKPSNIRLSNASALSNEHEIVTANYGKALSHGVSQSVATETSALDDARFTADPASSVSRQESVSDIGSASTRPGLVQSLSTRNWLLLIGGLIVIALLFAPGRTRRLTMNGQPVNG